MRWTHATWLVTAVGLAACGRESVPLRVVRVQPAPHRDGVLRVAVNQEITVHFSETVEPLSVTEDTFRVIGADGLGVVGEIVTGTRAITFRPVPPVTPALMDGSFRPGHAYRLELPGFPRSNRIRSTNGSYLDRRVSVEISVPADPTELGLPTAFLPVGIGSEPFLFYARPDRALAMTVESRRLRMDFTLPILPSSVRPQAIQFHRLITGQRRPEPLTASEIRVLPERAAGTLHHGSSLEVVFDPEQALAVGDVVYLTFADGADALRDYRGRALLVTSESIHPIRIDPGERELTDIRLSDGDAPLSFEWRNKRMVTRCRVEAGSARLGDFRPRHPIVLRVGESFDRGDGETIAVGPVLEFARIDIDEGVEVIVEGPISLRATGAITIRGRLSVVAARSDIPWRTGESPSAAQLLDASAVSLVAGGDIRVSGQVEQRESGGVGAALTMLAGGDVSVSGRVPAGAVLAIEPGRRLLGAIESPLVLAVGMTPGLPAGVELSAVGWTGWHRVGDDTASRPGFSLRDPRGDVRAQIQVAPPHPVDPSLPHDDERVLRQPVALPVAGGLEVPAHGFVRFRLEAAVTATATPSLAGISIGDR